MFVNNLDPVAFEFLSFQIRWYSLAYIFGFLIGWFYIKNFLTKDLREKTLVDDFITYLILGVIIGGRLGYVIFYNFFYYLSHPFEIFFIWQGGMSFHGGLLGVCLATYIFTQKYNLNLMDIEGMQYNPIFKSFKLSKFDLVNYFGTLKY